jgi:hypothetical protein
MINSHVNYLFALDFLHESLYLAKVHIWFVSVLLLDGSESRRYHLPVQQGKVQQLSL